MSASIREARTGDGAAILSMIVEHTAHEKENFDPTGKVEHLEEWLKLKDHHCTFLVMEENETLIGYCSFYSQFDSWYQKDYIFVDTLYLRLEARGRGLGKKFMDRVFLDAKQKNLSMVQLVTPDHNSGAIEFYNKLGGRATTKQWYTFDMTREA